MQTALEWQQDRYRTARERINAAGVEFQRKQQAKREREQDANLPKIVLEKCADTEPPPVFDYIRPPKHSEVIIREVSEKHGVSVLEILSSRRHKYIIPARQETCWRLSKETLLSLPMIGRIMRRDHTTIMHSISQHEKRMEASR